MWTLVGHGGLERGPPAAAGDRALRIPGRVGTTFKEACNLGRLQLHGNLCSFNTAMKSRSLVEDWPGAIELLEVGAWKRSF